MSHLQEELSDLLNRHSAENESDTPDYILAQYLIGSLLVYNATVKARDKWYDFHPWARSPELTQIPE